MQFQILRMEILARSFVHTVYEFQRLIDVDRWCVQRSRTGGKVAVLVVSVQMFLANGLRGPVPFDQDFAHPSDFGAIKSIVVLFRRGAFNNFAQIRSPNDARQPKTGFTSTLVSASSKAPAMYRFTLKGSRVIDGTRCDLKIKIQFAYLGRPFFTPCSVRKLIRSFVTLTLRTLIYVDPLVIHFQNRDGSVPK